jgi:hypothetical protein
MTHYNIPLAAGRTMSQQVARLKACARHPDPESWVGGAFIGKARY